MFGATFKLVTRVGLMQFFVTLTDGSLEINSLALNNCFSYRNVFQNDANALSKMDLKYPFFFLLSKSSQFCEVSTIRFCSNFTGMWYKHLLRNVWRNFRLLMSAVSTVAGKSFNSKFTAKNYFPIGYLMLPLLILTLKVLRVSIHYLISILIYWKYTYSLKVLSRSIHYLISIPIFGPHVGGIWTKSNGPN